MGVASNGSGPAASGNGHGNGASAPSPAAPQETAPAQAAAAPADATAPTTGGAQIVDVLTPAAGESVTEGTILEWHAKVGDPIKANDTIVEISTDKVDVELPSPATGTVTELLVQEGDTVTVGQVIARIAVGAADGSAPGSSGNGHGNGGAAAQPAPPAADQADGVKVSPVAARAAAVEGVSLSGVSGSGPAGRITKADVLSAAADRLRLVHLVGLLETLADLRCMVNGFCRDWRSGDLRRAVQRLRPSQAARFAYP